MSDNLHDTKPRPAVQVPTEPQRPAPTQPLQPHPRPHQPNYDEGVPAPPRFLLWGVILIFVLGIVAVIGSVAAFRFVLEPAQQERIMQALPFMEVFMPARPAPGDTLPTPDTSAITTDLSPADLLGGGVGNPSESTAEPTVEPTAQSTVEATLEPTAEPSLEPTAAPTSEPTVVPTESAQAAPTVESAANVSEPVSVAVNVPALPRSNLMTGISYQKQTWNNCGPSNITMALSYYGWQRDQTYAAQFLKPGGREDKNVSPDEMVAFVNEQSSVRALYRVGGTVDQLRALLANGFPVVIETGFMPEGYDWIGHYRTLVGYDDNQGTFYLYDSFLAQAEGTPIPETYPALDRMWRHFNRTYIVIYEPQREELLQSIMGDHWDERAAAESALEVATAEATADRTDGHAWFNLGSSLTALGDYERAAIAFDRARVEGVPWRMTWYQFGPFEAYYGAGRYNEVLSLVDANLANGADYVEETYYWQGRALNALNRGGEAATAFRTALRRKPSYSDAQTALNELGL